MRAGTGGSGWLAPMLATLLKLPEEQSVLERDDWVYERKLDGLRGIAVRDGDRVDLWSRNHLSFNTRFPELVAAIGRIPVPSFVLDGEIVAFSEGRTSFQLLQAGHAAGGGIAVYVAFDLISLLGRDTTGIPLDERCELLRRAVGTDHQRVRVSEQLTGEPAALLDGACRAGWEGLVAKRRSSLYRSGRSGDWRKLKCSARQELVVGGWTDPSGTRTGFGALLVGYYVDDRLMYAGKVGTGFDEQTLRRLHAELTALGTGDTPFSDAPRMRGAHWVRPELVAEVEFTEWTRDGRLRHPRFRGLRPDKPARQVRREA